MHILFVCTANIARSPLAEVLLGGYVRARSLHGQITVSSAGVRARSDDPAAAGSMSIAQAWGLDLSNHRSRPATPEIVGVADLIVTMSERQRDQLGGRDHGVHSRAFTLRELARLLDEAPSPTAAPGADRVRAAIAAAHRQRPRSVPPGDDEDVADPFGGPAEGYATMGSELVRLHERIVPTLLG